MSPSTRMQEPQGSYPPCVPWPWGFSPEVTLCTTFSLVLAPGEEMELSAQTPLEVLGAVRTNTIGQLDKLWGRWGVRMVSGGRRPLQRASSCCVWKKWMDGKGTGQNVGDKREQA